MFLMTNGNFQAADITVAIAIVMGIAVGAWTTVWATRVWHGR
jgi:hypothetical protein